MFTNQAPPVLPRDGRGGSRDRPTADRLAADRPPLDWPPLDRMTTLGRGNRAAYPPLDRAVLCPVCAGPCAGRRCPRCGHDLLSRKRTEASRPGGDGTAGARVRAGWVAIAQADPDYYETATATGDLEAPRVPFPRSWPARYFALDGERAWIGRRGRSRAHRPEIDLGGSPADPGVARLHALLLAVPHGGWALMDPGSATGTTVNDDPTPLPVDVLVPLAAGDRIHVGAWTTIVLQRSGAAW